MQVLHHKFVINPDTFTDATIIVARYVNQIQGEKRLARTVREARIEQFKMRTENSTYSASDSASLLPPEARMPETLKEYVADHDDSESCKTLV